MLVPFTQIDPVTPSQATAINSAVNSALGPVAGHGARTTLYDPAWGYFIFGQSQRTEYHDTMTYIDHGEFTITGEFNIDAEDATAGSVSASEDQRFNRCVAKYNSLESLFVNAGRADAPQDFNDWGGAADPRCIALPAPLRGPAGVTIYALPLELDIEPGQWGKFVRYRATLKEAKFPSAKVMLNSTFIDDGVITLSLPKPILIRTPLVGCVGEVIQVQNYSVLEVEVQGTISGIHPSGSALTDVARDFIQDLGGSMNINVGVVRIVGSNAVVDNLWPGLALEDGSNAEIDYAHQLVQVSVKAKAVR